jgi:hypothetical protein
MYGSKVKAAMMALIAVFALSAVAVSSASAGSWFVNGTKLAKGATVAISNTAAVDESTVLSQPSLGVRLTCSGKTLEGKGGYIQGEANGGAESLTFTGCSEITPTNCTIQTTVNTEPVVASVETGTAPLTRIRFLPKTGKTFATINFTGECAESGKQPVNGQVVLDSKTGQTESVGQPLEGLGTTENNSLELFKAKAYLVGGKALLTLAGGPKWSFH